MSQRKPVSGRPSGTDGSDFSYRMVVDSRYQNVAEGKSRLSKLIFIQYTISQPTVQNSQNACHLCLSINMLGVLQLLAAVVLYLSTLEGGTLDTLSVSSSAICFISLLIGELGRKRSRAGLLKLYRFGSSVGVLISFLCLCKSEKSLKIISDLSKWETAKFETFRIALVSLSVLVQIFAVTVATSLIGNMAPPKRAS